MSIILHSYHTYTTDTHTQSHYLPGSSKLARSTRCECQVGWAVVRWQARGGTLRGWVTGVWSTHTVHCHNTEGVVHSRAQVNLWDKYLIDTRQTVKPAGIEKYRLTAKTHSKLMYTTWAKCFILMLDEMMYCTVISIACNIWLVLTRVINHVVHMAENMHIQVSSCCLLCIHLYS